MSRKAFKSLAKMARESLEEATGGLLSTAPEEGIVWADNYIKRSEGEMQSITVEKKGNGFLLSARLVEEADGQLVGLGHKEIVVEGWDPAILGEAIIKMFAKPRGPRKRRAG